MTVRRREDRGNAWHVDFVFRHADGRRERIRRQSPVNTKAGAEEYERQLRQKLMADGTLKDTSMTLDELFEEYIQAKSAEVKHTTINLRRGDYNAYIRETLGDMQVAQIDSRIVAGFMARLPKHLSAASVGRILSTLSAVLSTAKAWGIIKVLPDFHPPKIHRKPPCFLSFEEADRLLEVSGPVHTAVAIGLKAGLRVGEIFGLRWSDIDFQRKELHVRQQKFSNGSGFGTTKNGKERVVPMPESLVTVLRQTPRMLGCDLVLHKQGKGVPSSKHFGWLQEAFQDAEIERSKGIGWHILRHTYASHLVIKGVPLKVVQELLGHADIHMTMVYAHLSPVTKSAAVAVLDVPSVTPNSEAAHNLL